YCKDLVGNRNHTLFVGVDEYDAPVNNIMFLGTLASDKRVKRVEQFFNERFFSWLKQACGMLGDGKAIIQKYFLTGVLSAVRAGVSPLLEVIPVSTEHQLHGICGFTETEVKAVVKQYLQKSELETDSIVMAM